MSSFNVYVCDMCGSKSNETENQFKPDEWFYGRVDNIHITLPFVDGIEGYAGHFCSVNCAKILLGSIFLSAKAHIETQCDKYLDKNGTDFNRKGLILTDEDEEHN